MLKRQMPTFDARTPSVESESDYIALLRAALHSGLTALGDPLIEARVREYFDQNPTFSRDPVHVAAVACQFAEQRHVQKNEKGVRP